jgi:hypothetical protein
MCKGLIMNNRNNYFGARYYDADISVWLSVDPMSDSSNFISPYSYCYNQPIRHIDPTGRIPILPVLAVAWAIAEVALTVYDGYETVKTLTDKESSTAVKTTQTAFFFIGLFAPGGGYGTLVKNANRLLFKVGAKQVDNIDDFYRAANKLASGERIVAYKEAAELIAKNNKWVPATSVMKKNKGRVIYSDNKGNLYSLDKQHGRFEVHDARTGKHKGEVDFAGRQTKGPDRTGKHDISI